MELLRRGRSRLWVEQLLRGADQRLDGALELPPTSRGIEPGWFPRGVIPVVGARDQSEGTLGVLQFSHDTRTLASPFVGSTGGDHPSGGSVHAIESAIAMLCEPLSEFLPETLQPHASLHLSGEPSGDSLALPAALGALLWIFDSAWPEDLVASGGLSPRHDLFAPAPSKTLVAKARAARAWGYRRIALVEDPDDPRTEIEGLEVVRFPRDPASLPLRAASLAGVGFSEQSLARALALFDLRVCRSGRRSADRVLEATAPMLESDSGLVRHIAFDMRSRVQLHAGRTAESEESLSRADEFRGRGSLPEGRLRDVLRYQQPAHRSMIHIDLGQWDDQLPAHREVDRLVADLDGLWPTRHERLMRFFLANTRARRNEYIGRLESDPGRLEDAWSDLEHDRAHWIELIDDFAIRELRLPDTSVARIQNQMIDVAFSHFQLAGSIPVTWRPVIESFDAQASPLDHDPEEVLLEFVPSGGGSIRIGGNGFDAIARLKRHQLLALPGLPAEVESILDAVSAIPLRELHYPWPQWLELVGLAALERGSTLAIPGGGALGELMPAWGLGECDPLGIASVLALRSHHVLSRLGHRPPDPVPPTAGSPLCGIFDELSSDPSALLRRTPY